MSFTGKKEDKELVQGAGTGVISLAPSVPAPEIPPVLQWIKSAEILLNQVRDILLSGAHIFQLTLQALTDSDSKLQTTYASQFSRSFHMY